MEELSMPMPLVTNFRRTESYVAWSTHSLQLRRHWVGKVAAALAGQIG